MLLKQLNLKNFRCYENLSLAFHPKLTVLVAINGEGKTTILDALRIGFWPFVSQFDLARTAYNDPANTLTTDDVRITQMSSGGVQFQTLNQMTRHLPCKIQLECEFKNQSYEWARVRKSEAKNSRTLDGIGCKRIKGLAKNLQEKIRDPQAQSQALPLFGYYGTGRLWSHKRVTSSKKTGDEVSKNIRTFAYQDCLDPASSFRQFEEWFSQVFKIAREQQIKALEQDKKLRLEETSAYQLIQVVQTTVNHILEPLGWHSLAYSEQLDQSLILQHSKQGVLKVSQLSDGIKNMLGMVADIAYRCVQLNSHLGLQAAEDTTGVIMIDEVDMHLHPQWQQSVLGSLMKAFPSLQFVVTTHSPQVLTTVASESIRIFKDGEVYSAPKGSQGAEASRLLTRIFGVATRPPLEENTKNLEEYAQLVYADKWNTESALKLRKKLDEIFGNEEPKLTELDLYIENREWELSLEED
ncbi:MAG TPA: AAA family ATPase [Thiopseudomonas sp.]|nr:AAA family ATPase [Pseudomonas sp.]HKM38603.1 AAA family ATPase [Thiopseudomonas sp.]